MIAPLPGFSELASAWDIELAGLASPDELARRQRERLAALVGHARRQSAFYRELYRGLPTGPVALDALPVVRKPQLMDAFEDWVCDPEVQLDAVKAFVADPARIGGAFLGRHAVWKSSGTSGRLGLFLHDRTAIGLYDRLFLLRAWMPLMARPGALGFWTGGARMACVTATEGHYAAIASWRRIAREQPMMAPLMRDFSVLSPIGELVAGLNDWQPAQIAGYPSIVALLAREQAAGRLRISPALIHTGGETLGAADRALIGEAFGCIVRSVYACSEADYLAFECAEGWLHLNADWFLLEPVDAEGRPVPPGTASHSCLLTNLANRVQPIIRYDLGDSLTLHPGRCACGNRLPALRVEGRREQRLRYTDSRGEAVIVLPMAITTVLECVAGLDRFQIVQTGERAMTVHCEVAPEAEPARVVAAARRDVLAFLAARDLAGVALRVDREPPRQDPVSGKFHEVISRLGRAA